MIDSLSLAPVSITERMRLRGALLDTGERPQIAQAIVRTWDRSSPVSLNASSLPARHYLLR